MYLKQMLALVHCWSPSSRLEALFTDPFTDSFLEKPNQTWKCRNAMSGDSHVSLGVVVVNGAKIIQDD